MKKYIRAAEEMSYQEFKDTYAWAIKQYPDVVQGFGSDRLQVTLNEESYEKQGGRWVLTNSTEEQIPFIYYMNAIDATPFFKNLGGKERVIKAYTPVGYIPVEIQSTSPDGREKTIRKYKFRYK